MIIFCSDVHLHNHPNEMNSFRDFVTALPENTKSLFILGDLFEVWWGDDHRDEAYLAWEDIFAALPIPIYFVPGNRDFLCGQHFFKKTGLIPLKSSSTIQYGGHSILLFHGDEPNLLKDLQYHHLRPWLRSSWLQKIFLTLPESWRASMAKKARRYSHPPTTLLMDYTHVLKNFPETSMVVHGHLHYEKETIIKHCAFYQLGTWSKHEKSWLSVHEDGNVVWGMN